MSVVIAGGGALGLLTALSMARRGRDVTVVDRDDSSGSATADSFAWVNANRRSPQAYAELGAAGFGAHARLQAALAPAQPWFHPTGCLLWDSRGGSAYAHAVDYADYPTALLGSSELAGLEPHLRLGEEPAALLFPAEGWVDVDLFTAALSDALAAAGAQRVEGAVAEVRSTASGAEAVLTSGASLTAEAVVIAAGAASGEISATGCLPVPMRTAEEPSVETHSWIAFADAPTGLISRVLISEDINIRPRAAGGLVLQASSQCRDFSGLASPGGLERAKRAVADHLTAWLARMLPDAGPVTEVRLAQRSLPADGRPILGPLDDHGRILAMVAHSGITLGPHIAELTAAALDGGFSGPEADLLAPFSARRFVEGRRFDGPSQSGIGRQ